MERNKKIRLIPESERKYPVRLLRIRKVTSLNKLSSCLS